MASVSPDPATLPAEALSRAATKTGALARLCSTLPANMGFNPASLPAP
jgi:hypothetical protein